MNHGIIGGLKSDPGWTNYQPALATTGTGSEVQPVVTLTDTNGGLYGRYFILEKQIVVAQITMQFLTGASVGSGTSYVMSLPFPALRWSGQGVTAPIPIGLANAYTPFGSPNIDLHGVVTLADPFSASSAFLQPGSEDRYCQFYFPCTVYTGSASATAANSVVVTHNLGYAPNAEDIDITPTTTQTGTIARQAFVDTITSTQFTYHTGLSSPTGTWTINWKIRAEPPTGTAGSLCSPIYPFAWTLLNTLRMNIAYQARL